MQDRHRPARSRAPIALAFAGASARETSRAWVGRAGSPRYHRLAGAFPYLPEALLVGMAQGVEETFLPGETIVREGDPADRFYIIESGQVEGTQSPRERGAHALTMRAGEYFGEVGLLGTRTRTATVRALSVVRVVSLHRVEFQALVGASDSTATNLGPLVNPRTRGEISHRTCSGAEHCKFANRVRDG
jgi:CRP-like cAMP-binding protein